MDSRPGQALETMTGRAAGGPEPGGVSIETVAIPTCGRQEALGRCLTSYIENTRRHGRAVDFVVADDSQGRAARQATRGALGDLGRRHGVTIRYAGLEEKLVFARAMIGARRVPADVVKFALFDVVGYGYTAGANRNALALETAGAGALQVDDDSVCRAAFPPAPEPGLAVVPDHRFAPAHPCEFWIQPDRRAVLEAVRIEDADVIGLHQGWLGRTFEDAVRAAGQAGPVDIEAGDERFAGRTAAGQARIRATVNGVLGDCGWPTPLFYLFLSGASLARLTRSEPEYLTAFTSREVFRVARRLTLVDGASSTGGFACGLDQRRPLAPQLPIGRGQDVLYWKTLEKSRPDGWIAHLPWALLHLPPEARCFSRGDALRPRKGVELFRLLLALLDDFQPPPASEPGGDRSSALGAYVEDWGRRPAGDLEDFLRHHVLEMTARQIAYLEGLLAAAQDQPGYWARDVRQLIAVTGEALGAREEGLAPIDLLHAGGPAEAWQLARSLLVQFGRLLQWWPEMTALAGDLRSRGCRLATPVDPA